MLTTGNLISGLKDLAINAESSHTGLVAVEVAGRNPNPVSVSVSSSISNPTAAPLWAFLQLATIAGYSNYR